MKEFMKTWTIDFINLFGVLIRMYIIVCIFFGVIYWLDKIGVIGYIGVVMLGIYLLNDTTLKGFIYVGLWILFVIVTTLTSYIRYHERREK